MSVHCNWMIVQRLLGICRSCTACAQFDRVSGEEVMGWLSWSIRCPWIWHRSPEHKNFWLKIWDWIYLCNFCSCQYRQTRIFCIMSMVRNNLQLFLNNLIFLHLNISALKQNFKILDLNSRLTKFVPHKPVQGVKV